MNMSEAAWVRDLEEKQRLLTKRVDQIEGTNNWLKEELTKVRAQLDALTDTRGKRAANG